MIDIAHYIIALWGIALDRAQDARERRPNSS
jgi:hypothetical protein